MKKTSLLLALGLGLVLASAAAPKAKAGVVVRVAVGTPVYVQPMHAYGYFVPRPYVASAPAPVYLRVYVAPVSGYYRHWYPRRCIARRDFYRFRR